MWKQRLIQAIWILAGIAVVVLLGAAINNKNNESCRAVKVEIVGVEKDMFISEDDVEHIINSNGEVKGLNIAAIDLRGIEAALEKNPWVKNAELFFDNKQALIVKIEEREPIARVFTSAGSSFYLDSAGKKLPLSDTVTARVPMFTGYTADKPVLQHADSILQRSVLDISKYLVADSFWNAQVAQIDITPQGVFEMVPVLGDHIVTLGNANDLAGKFARLYTFYKSAWLQNGIGKYERIDVQFNWQVVGIKRGAVKPVVDSAKAQALIDAMMAAGTDVADSVKMLSTAQVNSLPVKRDTLKATGGTAVPTVVPKPATRTTTAPAVPKPKPATPVKPVAKPKAGAGKKVSGKPAGTTGKPKAATGKPTAKPAANANGPKAVMPGKH